MNRGLALAASFPVRLRERLGQVAEPDLLAHQEEVASFTDYWLQRDAVPLPADILDILAGDREQMMKAWLCGSADIGTEAVGRMSPTDCGEYLGLREGRPITMRRHIADDWRAYRDTMDVAIPGVTRELLLMPHQLQAVVFVLQALCDPILAVQPHLLKQHGIHKYAPIALRDGYSNVPGALIADDVGLGKSLTTIATICTIAHLRDIKARPPCRGRTSHAMSQLSRQL